MRGANMSSLVVSPRRIFGVKVVLPRRIFGVKVAGECGREGSKKGKKEKTMKKMKKILMKKNEKKYL